MSRSARLLRAAYLGAAVTLSACSEAATSSLLESPVVASTAVTCAPAETLTAGQVLTGISGTSVCVGGVAASAEYALVAFNSAPASSATFSISATDVTTPSASTDLIAASSVSTLSPSFDLGAAATYHPLRGFEAQLRMKERAVLTPLIPSARAWQRQRATRGAAFDVIPGSVTTGQLLRLNANGTDACASPSYRMGRVVAVTSKAIIVADTTNPLEGNNAMRVFQEEIFGPVVSVTKFKDLDDALAIANDTLYGLGAGVWSRDANTCYRMGRGIKAGRVWTNCYHLYPAGAAFGGYKQSGIGRENHKMMLSHYQQTKNLLVSYSPDALGFF